MREKNSLLLRFYIMMPMQFGAEKRKKIVPTRTHKNPIFFHFAMDEQGYHSNSHTRTARGQEYQQRVVGRMRCRKEGQRRQETRSADLHELHEEVDVLGVELLAEVVDGLVHVLRQRVLLAAPDEVALAPDPLHVLPRRRRQRRRRGRRHFGGFHWAEKGK